MHVPFDVLLRIPPFFYAIPYSCSSPVSKYRDREELDQVAVRVAGAVEIIAGIAGTRQIAPLETTAEKIVITPSSSIVIKNFFIMVINGHRFLLTCRNIISFFYPHLLKMAYAGKFSVNVQRQPI
jgi:hypothetical protein